MQSLNYRNNDASQHGSSAPLKRAMSTRHLVMISLGGAIGTGLFLGSGDVISQAGPIGAIISYFLGGLIAYTVMLCLGRTCGSCTGIRFFWGVCASLYWSGYGLYDYLALLVNLDCNFRN